MSDATLPPPRSSSPAPTAEAAQRSDSSSGEGEFDTSLESCVSAGGKEESAGDGEGRTDNKQKRKRTSPEDQATLEAEYKLNPKPNKAARAEIVERVKLNEKEVQIWFQNRRQIHRRKQRPLLPHEIAAFGLGGLAALSSDPSPMAAFSSSQTMVEGIPSSQQEIPSGPGSSQVEFLEPREIEERVEVVEGEGADVYVNEKASSLPPPIPALNRQSSSGLSGHEASSSSSANESVVQSFSSTPGYLANRWNSIHSSFSIPSSSHAPTFVTPTISETKQPASCPERIGLSEVSTPSSQVRLSMSIDGKAELVSTSPSPPRALAPRPSSSSGSFPPQKRMRTLHRSQSALPFGPPSSSASLNAPIVPRLPTGRSRDARTWEFCCDGDVRDELTTQAENESTGSAVAAISLLRSTSSSALKPNANKRNAAPAKDSSKHGKKQKLGRAMSSLARLQNPGKIYQEPPGYGKDGLMRSPSGDSDKENWVPGENGANLRRRPLPSARSDKQSNSRMVLGDNLNVPTHASFSCRRNRKQKSANVEPNIFEDQENREQGSEEAEKFMRGEISPSKKGDLDCVQGLLSLSQGNWR